MPIGGTDDNMAPAPVSGGLTQADLDNVRSLSAHAKELEDDMEAKMATTDGRVATMTSTVAIIGKAANLLMAAYSRHAAEKPSAVPHASPVQAATGALSALLNGQAPDSIVRGLLSQFST